MCGHVIWRVFDPHGTKKMEMDLRLPGFFGLFRNLISCSEKEDEKELVIPFVNLVQLEI